MPAYTPPSPNTTVPKRYSPHVRYLPSRRSLSWSWLNEENVVKPPQKPVISRAFNAASISWRPQRPKNIPMRKQPTTFTIYVPIGNDPWNNRLAATPVKYLPQVPKNPPIPAINIDSIMILFSLIV